MSWSAICSSFLILAFSLCFLDIIPGFGTFVDIAGYRKRRPACGRPPGSPSLCNIHYKIEIYGNQTEVSTVFPDKAAFRIRWRNQQATGIWIPAFAGMTGCRLSYHLNWNSIPNWNAIPGQPGPPDSRRNCLNCDFFDSVIAMIFGIMAIPQSHESPLSLLKGQTKKRKNPNHEPDIA